MTQLNATMADEHSAVSIGQEGSNVQTQVPRDAELLRQVVSDVKDIKMQISKTAQRAAAGTESLMLDPLEVSEESLASYSN